VRALVAVLVITVLLGIAFAVLVATRTLPFLGGSGSSSRAACTGREHAQGHCARPSPSRR
jgi:hypothetical protein